MPAAPSSRALARSGRPVARPGTAVAVRPKNLPARRPVAPSPYRPRPRPPVRRRPIPGRRSIRIGGKRYDREQVAVLVKIGVALIVLAWVTRDPAVDVVEAVSDPAPETVAAAAPPTAQAVLQVAQSQVGVTEARDRGTPFHDAYGLPRREPWCAVFAVVMFDRAGHADLIPRTAYTPTMANWYRARGAFDRDPRPGDLIFFNWPGDGIDRIQHVGIVVSVEPGAVRTIEGNTGTGGGGNPPDGVYERRRPLDSSVVGFGHPAYAGAA